MLKAGFARLDVTPPLGTFVPGAYANRFSETVLDPIYINALAISLGEETCEADAGNDLVRALEHYCRIREGIVTPCGLDDVMQELQYA